jgi:hypothetical protein
MREATTTVILATGEAKIRRIMVQGQIGQIVHKTPTGKVTTAKMDWRCGSSDRAPALQVQSPYFKP